MLVWGEALINCVDIKFKPVVESVVAATHADDWCKISMPSHHLHEAIEPIKTQLPYEVYHDVHQLQIHLMFSRRTFNACLCCDVSAAAINRAPCIQPLPSL